MGVDEYFKDKCCLVTCANSGIGYAISEALLEKGAIVFVVGRNAESLESAAKGPPLNNIGNFLDCTLQLSQESQSIKSQHN